MKIKKNNSILYWAICDQIESPGVFKKVTDFVLSANELGISAVSRIQKPGSYKEHIISLLRLVACKEEILIIRYNNFAGPVLFIFILLLRVIGKKIILDVPTPILHHLRFILNNKKSLRNYLEIIIALVLGPLPFITANLVLQYSNESFYFNPKYLTNCLLIGNGIRTKKFDYGIKGHETSEIKMLAVGTIATWHGWDRVIKALSILLIRYKKTNITLDIVGEGPEKKELILLTKKLNLFGTVNFHANMIDEDLTALYKKSNLCIGSFGWDRLGLTIASPLKHREYLANGLPFIYATMDPDIVSNCNVAFKLNPEEESIAIFLNNIEIDKLPSQAECQKYCFENMSFSKKIPEILERII